jgi:hypothetical protein
MHTNLFQLFIALAFALSPLMGSPQASVWQREEKTDQLRGTTYSQFSLPGKFLTPPKNSAGEPKMVVRCIGGQKQRKGNSGYTNGKFLNGFIAVSTVLDSGESVPPGRIKVQFRLDDGKIQIRDWANSTDFSAIFFYDVGSGWGQFANLLYGHELYHKENSNPQVRKVVIAVDQYLGGEIVMQFDMPDATEVGDTCGIIEHRK